MRMTLSQIAELVEGELTGNGELEIHGATILRDVQEGEITLADDEKQAERLTASPASAVIVPPDFTPEGIAYITVPHVHRAFTAIATHFQPPRTQARTGISPAAHVNPSATIGANVDIHPSASVGEDVVLGDGCTIHSGACLMAGTVLGPEVTIFPNAVLYEDTQVGARSVIHAGASIGAYGFGYDTVEGAHQRGAQLGRVEIGDDVEIGANTTIDRGTYGPTTIGDGTKIDNLVMIGHNCRLGKHNILCSQVGMAGSCETGDYVVMGGQAGIKDHLKIGNFAKVAATSSLMTDVPDNATYVGTPAMAERELWPIIASQKKLPEMRKMLKRLSRKVDELAAQASSAQASSAQPDRSEAA